MFRSTGGSGYNVVMYLFCAGEKKRREKGEKNMSEDGERAKMEFMKRSFNNLSEYRKWPLARSQLTRSYRESHFDGMR